MCCVALQLATRREISVDVRGDKVKVLEGLQEKTCAHASYDDTVDTNGWGQLTVMVPSDRASMQTR